MFSKIFIPFNLFLSSVYLIYPVECSGTDILYLKSISDKQISIPCHTSEWDENEVLLVLWYRENSAVPFYKLDSRNRQLSKAKHILISNSLSNRFTFDVTSNPPALKINPVLIEDEGEYRCRVDYKTRRTQSFSTFLEVFGRPKEVKIFNTIGQSLEGLIGPYDEFTYVELICEATDGNPSPTLIWFQSGILEVIIDSTYTINSSGVVRNELNLRKLDRKDYRTSITCRASSNGLYEPIDKTVVIDMNLKPLTVEISTKNSPLSAGSLAQFRCLSEGSKPNAYIFWTLNSRNMTDVYNSDIDDNTTESIVSFVPNFKHNNQFLICSAINEQLTNSTIEDRILLSVEFVPQIDISIETSQNKLEDIEEGNNIRIMCRVLANPKVDSIEWALNGKLIKNPELIDDNQTLILRNIKRNQSGKYQCTASNSIGKTISQILMLSIKFSPICKSGQQIYYNVIRNLVNRMECSVEALPVDSSLKFKWFVNTSIELFELKTIDRLENDLTTSIANYRPKTIMNYAMVLCVAENSVGVQREPCILYLRITNGPPESVRNCEITNKSHSILMVECMAGNNGGLPQTFHLEVYKTLSEELHSNYTSLQPNFIIDSLLPETLYNFVVYSSNAKGNSIGLTYNSVRLPVFETLNKSQKELNPLLNSLIGIVASIVIFSVFIAAVIKIRAYIYEDEYNIYHKHYDKRLSNYSNESSSEVEQDKMIAINSEGASDLNNLSNTNNSTLSSLKRLTNRLKATKCKTYEVTGIGKYTKVSDNSVSKKAVTFATFDEIPKEDSMDEEFNERPIDVEQQNDEPNEDMTLQTGTVVDVQNSAEIKSEIKMKNHSTKRSKFFKKSFFRKTL